MTTFADADQLATYLYGITDAEAAPELGPEWVEQANYLLQLISADIEDAAGVPIEVGTDVALTLPGTWSRDLELPAGATTAVSSVSLNGEALAVGTYTWNNRTLIRRGVSSLNLLSEDEMEEDWNAYGMQGASWRGGFHWGGPASTVTVVRSLGFATLPPILESLAIRIAARTIGNPEQLTQETLAIYSSTYRTTGFDGSHVTDAERRRLRRVFGTATGGTITVAGR